METAGLNKGVTVTNVLQRIACKAVIVNDGNVLVLREASTYDEGTNGGKYQVPGGRVEPGEAFLDGLKREVMEETGLVITVDEPFFVGEWFPTIKGVPNQIVAIFFRCESSSRNVTLSSEHDEYKWVTLNESESLTMASPEHEVIEKYFESKI